MPAQTGCARDLNGKQRVISLLFPERISYENQKQFYA